MSTMNSMFRSVFLVVCLLVGMQISEGTYQAREFLRVLDEKEKVVRIGAIEERPLSSVLKKKGIEHGMVSTAHRLGYMASWMIKDKKLYLEGYYYGRDVIKYARDVIDGVPSKSKVKELFPDSDGVVFAKWFSGTILLSTGKNKGYRSHHLVITEHLYVYKIEKGIVKNEKGYDFPDNVDYWDEMMKKKGFKEDLKSYFKDIKKTSGTEKTGEAK